MPFPLKLKKFYLKNNNYKNLHVNMLLNLYSKRVKIYYFGLFDNSGDPLISLQAFLNVFINKKNLK